MHRALVGRPSHNARFALATALLISTLGSSGCGPSDPVAEIRQQQAAGNFEATLEPLRKLIAERPDEAELDFLYGRALYGTGQPSLAQWPMRKAMEDPDWLVPAGLALAVAAGQTYDYPGAIEAAGRVLEADPNNLQALVLRANANALSKLHYEEALADVERVLELDPDNMQVMQPRILSLVGLERYEELAPALDELGERIDELQPGPDVEGWFCATRAIFADDSGELELARERWADCVERFPAHSNVVSKAVEFYDSKGERDRSLEILRRAQQAEPRWRPYRLALAEHLRAADEAAEAEDLLRQGTRSEDPELAARAWFDLAAHHAALGQQAQEAEAARQAVELTRQLGQPVAELLLVYADALLRAGELDAALAVADDLSVAAHQELIRARVAQERGQPAEAVAHFEQAVRLWPDNVFARYYAALAFEALGDFDRAVEAYRYAIRISPAATEARMRVARLLAAQRQVQEALTLLRTQAGHRPLDLEGELLSVRLAAWSGQTKILRASLQRLRRQYPNAMPRAVVEVAEGVRARGGGPGPALAALRRAEDIDLTSPEQADVLRALVRFSHEAGGEQEELARADLRAALAAHPDAAAFHEIQGLWLELRGAPAEEVRAEYARALELDPTNARALAALGRLALDGDPEEALALFERAAEANPADAAEAQRGAARALAASGRPEEAEQRFQALLGERPYDAEAAAALVEFQLGRGPATDRTLELAQRAVRFGGGAEGLDLLSRVYEARNEPQRASEAAARARALREQQAPGA